MAAKTDVNIRIKLIVVMVFACFLAAALWNITARATSGEQPQAAKPPVIAPDGVWDQQVLKDKGGFIRCYFNPDRAKEKKIVVVDKLAFDTPKTKRLVGILKTLGIESALLVVTPERHPARRFWTPSPPSVVSVGKPGVIPVVLALLIGTRKFVPSTRPTTVNISAVPRRTTIRPEPGRMRVLSQFVAAPEVRRQKPSEVS